MADDAAMTLNGHFYNQATAHKETTPSVQDMLSGNPKRTLLKTGDDAADDGTGGDGGGDEGGNT